MEIGTSSGWTLVLIATAVGWIVNGFLLCRITLDRRSPRRFTPGHPLRKLDEGFLVLDLKQMEHLMSQAREDREAMRASHEQLQQMIAEDPLTGCRNRRALQEQSAELWQPTPGGPDPETTDDVVDLACLMFDIDHFKKVNDDHGHATGDELLRRVGQTLRRTFAGVGQVYRYGGEEFCVMLPNMKLVEARWIAERVRQLINDLDVRSESSGQRIPITVSIGVTDRHRGAQSIDAMIDQADQCLYIAKRRGRDQVVVHDDDVDAAPFRNR